MTESKRVGGTRSPDSLQDLPACLLKEMPDSICPGGRQISLLCVFKSLSDRARMGKLLLGDSHLSAVRWPQANTAHRETWSLRMGPEHSGEDPGGIASFSHPDSKLHLVPPHTEIQGQTTDARHLSSPPNSSTSFTSRISPEERSFPG